MPVTVPSQLISNMGLYVNVRVQGTDSFDMRSTCPLGHNQGSERGFFGYFLDEGITVKIYYFFPSLDEGGNLVRYDAVPMIEDGFNGEIAVNDATEEQMIYSILSILVMNPVNRHLEHFQGTLCGRRRETLAYFDVQNRVMYYFDYVATIPEINEDYYAFRYYDENGNARIGKVVCGSLRPLDPTEEKLSQIDPGKGFISRTN